MVDKTLIAYFTKSGVTGENAQIIGDVLKNNHGFDVDIVNLNEKSKIDIKKYKNVIVGGGIRAQMWYRKPIRFLKKIDYEDKNLAIFFSSLEAGDPENHDTAIEKYITKKIINKLGLNPIAYEGFGGRAFKEDLTDPDKVKTWAEDLGIKLSAS
jgi:menaquinone-dependent protoporphyrinogen IX oxidase